MLLRFFFFFFFFFRGVGASAAAHSLQDLRSGTRDRTGLPEVQVQSPNHWTAREVPVA